MKEKNQKDAGPPKTVVQERDAIAQVLGISPTEVNIQIANWEKLLRESVVIQIHIYRWRGKQRMRLSDLGLAPIEDGEDKDKVDSTIFTIGEKLLLPPEYLKRAQAAESRARKNLAAKCTAMYFGSLVGVEAYGDWKQKDLAIQRDYFNVLYEVYENFPTVIRTMRDLYTKAGKQAYARLEKLYSKKKLPEEEEFVDRFVRAALRLMPERDEIYTSWKYDIEMNYIPLPSAIEKDVAEARVTQAAAAMEEAKILEEGRLEESRIRGKREIEAAKAYKNKMVLMDAAEMRKRMLEELNRDMVVNTRQRLENDMSTCVADVMRQVRGLIYDKSTEALESIEKSEGKIPSRTIVSLCRMLEQAPKKNLIGETDPDKMIRRMRDMLETRTTGRSEQEIASVLKDVALVSKAQLITLGEKPRSTRSLGIADQPDAESVRKARENLGLDLDAEGPSGRKKRGEQNELL